MTKDDLSPVFAAFAAKLQTHLRECSDDTAPDDRRKLVQSRLAYTLGMFKGFERFGTMPLEDVMTTFVNPEDVDHCAAARGAEPRAYDAGVAIGSNEHTVGLMVALGHYMMRL